MKYKVSSETKEFDIEILEDGDRLKVRIGKDAAQEMIVDFKTVGKGAVHSLLVGDDSYRLIIGRNGSTHKVYTRGHRFEYNVEDERTFLMRSLIGQNKIRSGGEVKAPIPGLVTKILIAEGETVTHGQGVMILEAMKMETEITAPISGIVKAVHVIKGESVNPNEVLIEIVVQ